MAYFQYLIFDGVKLPLPKSYDVQLSSIEADSSGETEAGTTQRDVIRAGVVEIPVSFSVTPAWLKKLSAFSKQSKIAVQYFDIQQLETLLEQNAEQRETLHKLMAQGYIDQILFTQENNALLTQANDFRSDIEALNRSQTLDTTKVYETERLIHFCERGKMLQKYNEELFELFVDHIEVYSRQSIGFVLHCGLTFKERI